MINCSNLWACWGLLIQTTTFPTQNRGKQTADAERKWPVKNVWSSSSNPMALHLVNGQMTKISLANTYGKACQGFLGCFSYMFSFSSKGKTARMIFLTTFPVKMIVVLTISVFKAATFLTQHSARMLTVIPWLSYVLDLCHMLSFIVAPWMGPPLRHSDFLPFYIAPICQQSAP